MADNAAAGSDGLPETSRHHDRMERVARTLIDSPEPQRQAAGLLLAETSMPWQAEYQPLMDESDFLDRLQTLIEQADTGLARALLAQLCALRDLQDYCRQRGLDAAIVEMDGAELFARLYLTGNDESQRLREVIVAAERLEERFMDYALILFEAFEAEDGLEMEEGHAIMAALSQAPGFSPISNLCQQPSVNDPELDQACMNVLESMIDDTQSILLTMLGSALLARRAEASGEAGAVSLHEDWRADRFEWMKCTTADATEVWEAADADFMREFIEQWQQYGEASAQAFVGAQAGVDCGLPNPPPWRVATRE